MATGGIASDGNDPFVVTRNTFTNPDDPWSDGEAVIRFQPGPIFSVNSSDYWGPYELAVTCGSASPGNANPARTDGNWAAAGEIYQAASCGYFASALRSRRGDRSICARLARGRGVQRSTLKKCQSLFF
jgi:hypothetical protein